MPFVQSMFVQCIDPLGYDSDLQRICIIKLVGEKKEKVLSFIIKCEVSYTSVFTFTLVVIYLICLFTFPKHLNDWVTYNSSITSL